MFDLDLFPDPPRPLKIRPALSAGEVMKQTRQALARDNKAVAGDMNAIWNDMSQLFGGSTSSKSRRKK